MEFLQMLDAKVRVTTVLWGAFLIPLGVYLTAILLRFSKQWVGTFLNALLFRASGLLSARLARLFTLKQYCRLSLERTSQYLHVPSRHDTRLPIDQMLVPLTVTKGPADSVVGQRDLVGIGATLLLVGDPGAGKSSLAKWVFREECRRACRKTKTARFPLLYELKNIQSMPPGSGGLFGLLRESVSSINAFMIEDGLEAFARSAGVLVVLDGLDEVSSTRYAEVEREIIALSQTLTSFGENNVLIVTMRTQFYHQVRDAYRNAFAATLFLRPFTDGDIYDFLSRWPFGESRRNEINRIFGELSERPTLKQMCRNPLVLAMYVAEDQAGGNVVPPDSRTQFYGKVTEELVLRRRLVQIDKRPVAPMKLKEQRERILGRLSFEHLMDSSQPANMLGFDHAVSIIEGVAGNDGSSLEKLRELCKETGLLSEERYGQSLRFIHLTFCEYFAAYYATVCMEDGWLQLVARHRELQNSQAGQERSRLREVLAFAAGLTPLARQTAALYEIESLGDDRLLLTCLLETKRYEGHLWPIVANRYAERISEASLDSVDEAWLSDLHFFGVVLRDAEACSEHVTGVALGVDVRAIFERLLEREPDALQRLISAYAMQDASAAFRLAEGYGHSILRDFPELVVRHCDQRPFFEFVRERAVVEDPALGWPVLLAEAGLRHRSAAQWLANSKPVSGLSELSKAPRRKNWSLIVGEENLLTQCLTAAAIGPPEAGLAKLLGSIRLPSVWPLSVGSAVLFIISWSLLMFGTVGVEVSAVWAGVGLVGATVGMMAASIGMIRYSALQYSVWSISGRRRLAELTVRGALEARRSRSAQALFVLLTWPVLLKRSALEYFSKQGRVFERLILPGNLWFFAVLVEAERDGFRPVMVLTEGGAGLAEHLYVR